jgi:hypothetical protein
MNGRRSATNDMPRVADGGRLNGRATRPGRSCPECPARVVLIHEGRKSAGLKRRIAMKFTPTRPAPLPAPLSALALTAVLLLAACGGEYGGEYGGIQAEPKAARQTIAPLIDEEGNVMPSDPSAVPVDPGAQTRARRYATAAQAEQLEHAMGGHVISIEVGNDADAAQAVDLAVMYAYVLETVQKVGNDAPVLVRGTDLRRAATLANRLQEHGYSRVFLVSP